MRASVFGLGVVVALLLALAVYADAASQAQIISAGNLNSGPHSDSSSVTALAAGTGVSIVERQGGWYHVRLASGQDGWVPMTNIRFNSAANTAPSGSANFASLFESGRSGSGAATTGVRGLNTGDIANAKPDPAAVKELDKWQAKPGEAKRYAAELHLQEHPRIAWLPKVKP